MFRAKALLFMEKKWVNNELPDLNDIDDVLDCCEEGKLKTKEVQELVAHFKRKGPPPTIPTGLAPAAPRTPPAAPRTAPAAPKTVTPPTGPRTAPAAPKTATPGRKTATPVRKTATPIRKSVTPVHKSVTPVRKTVTPRSTGETHQEGPIAPGFSRPEAEQSPTSPIAYGFNGLGAGRTEYREEVAVQEEHQVEYDQEEEDLREEEEDLPEEEGDLPEEEGDLPEEEGDLQDEYEPEQEVEVQQQDGDEDFDDDDDDDEPYKPHTKRKRADGHSDGYNYRRSGTENEQNQYGIRRAPSPTRPAKRLFNNGRRPRVESVFTMPPPPQPNFNLATALPQPNLKPSRDANSRMSIRTDIASTFGDSTSTAPTSAVSERRMDLVEKVIRWDAGNHDMEASSAAAMKAELDKLKEEMAKVQRHNAGLLKERAEMEVSFQQSLEAERQTFRQDLEVERQRLAEVQSQNEALARETAKAKSNQSNQQQLEGELRSKETSLKQLEDNVTNLQSDLNRARGRADRLANEKERLETQLNEIRVTQRSKEIESSSKIAELQGRNAQLLQECQDVGILEASNKELLAEIEKLTRANETMSTTISMNRTTIEQYRAIKEQLDEANGKLKDYQQYAEQNNDLKIELLRAKANNELLTQKYETAIADKARGVNDLNNAFLMSLEISELKTRLIQAVRVETRLRGELEEKDKEARTLQARLDAGDGELGTKDVEGELLRRVQDLSARVMDLERDLDAEEGVNASNKTLVETKQAELEKSISEVKRLHEFYADADRKHQEGLKAAEEAEKRVLEVNQSINAIRVELDEKKDELSRLEKTLADKTAADAEMKEIQTLEDPSVVELKTEVTRLERTLAQCETEGASLRETVQHIEQSNKAKDDQIASLKTEIEKVKNRMNVEDANTGDMDYVEVASTSDLDEEKEQDPPTEEASDKSDEEEQDLEAEKPEEEAQELLVEDDTEKPEEEAQELLVEDDAEKPEEDVQELSVKDDAEKPDGEAQYTPNDETEQPKTPVANDTVDEESEAQEAETESEHLDVSALTPQNPIAPQKIAPQTPIANIFPNIFGENGQPTQQQAPSVIIPQFFTVPLTDLNTPNPPTTPPPPQVPYPPTPTPAPRPRLPKRVLFLEYEAKRFVSGVTGNDPVEMEKAKLREAGLRSGKVRDRSGRFVKKGSRKAVGPRPEPISASISTGHSAPQ